MAILDLKIPPPIVGLLIALGMWLVASTGPGLPMTPSVRYTLAAIFVASGLIFDFLGLRAFRASRTTINPLQPQRASTLVTDGVYRVTRNPMYVGMCLLILGWAIFLSALTSLAGPILFVLYITRFQIRPEERTLNELFGERYTEYAARVRRWL